ncbi:MAG: GNAT family N-acetyltransferase [Symploca sp. SIO2G7]|nr:GNAT family N-acetyltransferase [Symploca sp. SIO2G7]
MHTKIISSLEDLVYIQEEWRHLFLEAEEYEVSQSPEWTLKWLKYFDKQSKLYIILVYERNQVIAVAPLLIRNYLGTRTLQFIGAEESDYNDFIVHKNWLIQAKLAITQALNESRHHWDIFEVMEASPGSIINSLVTPNWLPNTHLISLQETPCPKISLPSSWEAYLSTLDAKNQQDYRRRLRRLTEDHGLDVKFFYKTIDIEQKIKDFLIFRLDAWKRADRIEELPSLHLETDYISFVSEFCTEISNFGLVCLAQIYANNSVISSALTFLSKRKIFIYSKAYNRNYKRYGPGNLLDFFLIKYAIERGFDVFDFGRGDEPYKFKAGATSMNNNNYLVVQESLKSTISAYLTYRGLKRKEV